MKPAAFDYLVPTTVDAVVASLAEHGDNAQLLAGGQSLVPMMALRVARPEVLIDLNRVDGLSGIERIGDILRVGAMTRQAQVIASPVVAEALPSLAAALRFTGHFQTRNRGTLGGSISLADPSAESPAYALALDAQMELRSQGGSRMVAATEYFLSAYTTARAPDELLVAIHYPIRPRARIVVDEVARRRGDFATAGLVARVECEGGRVAASALAWFSMGPGPLRSPSAEAALNGIAVADIDPEALADLAVGDTDPFDDHHASAPLRRATARVLAIRTLTTIRTEELA
jgi:carbon-monoxide dehydrogenase medium subunit